MSLNGFSLSNLPSQLKQYLVITGNYWAFTLTDGALRMLVVLYFHQLGYDPFTIATLFIFYEFFGVVTNLIGGWLGARIGLNKTMNMGLALQIIALIMLAIPSDLLTVFYVMVAQALSGIAKDLNKMSAKSSIKLLVPDSAQSQLYKWIAILTGSKNALKGIGFFLGGLLLTWFSFRGAVFIMASMLLIIWIMSLFLLKKDLGKAKNKPKFTQLFSKSPAINSLSAARLFLFGARDVWFVIALPVYLSQTLGWNHWQVGCFLAVWVVGYGLVQSLAPKFTGKSQGKVPTGRAAVYWALILSIIPAVIALLLPMNLGLNSNIQTILIGGLLIFGGVFAINSSLHSYLIVSYARSEGVSMDIGFYYMANAMGRLIGTILSGWIFQKYGLIMCLWISSVFIFIAALLSFKLPKR